MSAALLALVLGLAPAAHNAPASAPVHLQDSEPRLPDTTITLADGTKVTGHATAYDGETRTLHFTTTEGEPRRFGLEQLDARSVYLVHRSIVPTDDGEAQLQLANLARDAGLYAHSARHYRNARRAAPELAADVDREEATMRRMAAEFCILRAEEALAAGNRREAERWLTRLLDRMPDEPLAERAAEMLEGLHGPVARENYTQTEKEAPDLLKTDLARGKRHFDAMVDHTKRGLQARGGSSARRDFERAISEGERALREVDRVAADREDAASQRALKGYREAVVEQLVQAHLHLGSLLMTRSSLNNAMAQVNTALALDPGNAEALAMRSRIEVASNRGIGWW
jgi:tetratricopeptide (TPR) repeat protein